MKYYRNADGDYLGGWDNNPPVDAIEVPEPPGHARQKWDDVNSNWLPLVLTQDEEDTEEIRNDPAINALLAKRPSEIDDHFGQLNNVPALAEQVALLTKQVKLLSGE